MPTSPYPWDYTRTEAPVEPNRYLGCDADGNFLLGRRPGVTPEGVALAGVAGELLATASLADLLQLRERLNAAIYDKERGR